MDIIEAVKTRNSVRKYTDRRIDEHARRELQNMIDTCNAEGHLHFQLVTDSPGVFEGIMARGFDNVGNYVALIRKKEDSDEKVGYYGEKVVLEAQMLGLNTCWVGLTYKKRKLDVQIKDDEKLVCGPVRLSGGDARVVQERDGIRDAGTDRHEPAEVQIHPQRRRKRQGRDRQGAVRDGRPRHSQAALRDRRRKGKLQVGVSPVPPREMRGGFLAVQ